MSIREVKKNKASTEKDVILYFSDFWRGFFRFWWVGALFALIFGAAACCFPAEPVYEASATFAVHPTGSDTFDYDATVAEQIADAFSYAVGSDILMDAVCADLNAESMPVIISVTTVEGSNMITLTAASNMPGSAYEALRSVLNHYSSVTDHILGPTELVFISDPQRSTAPVYQNGAVFRGVLLGLSLGALWITLYALLRRTLRTGADIRRELDLPCIGILPRSRSQFRNAMRLLAGAVQTGLGDGKILLVTSTLQAEGTTKTAMSLATMCAGNDSKVLLISSTDHTPTGLDHIHLPVAALRFEELKRSMDALRNRYDLIFVDASPCDALTLAGAVDKVLYVIRQDHALSTLARRQIDALRAVDADILGCVLTDVPGGPGGYGMGLKFGRKRP